MSIREISKTELTIQDPHSEEQIMCSVKIEIILTSTRPPDLAKPERIEVYENFFREEILQKYIALIRGSSIPTWACILGAEDKAALKEAKALLAEFFAEHLGRLGKELLRLNQAIEKYGREV